MVVVLFRLNWGVEQDKIPFSVRVYVSEREDA